MRPPIFPVTTPTPNCHNTSMRTALGILAFLAAALGALLWSLSWRLGYHQLLLPEFLGHHSRLFAKNGRIILEALGFFTSGPLLIPTLCLLALAALLLRPRKDPTTAKGFPLDPYSYSAH
jgi:hypothetical protein